MPELKLHHRHWPAGQPLNLSYPKGTLFDQLEMSAMDKPEHILTHFYGGQLSYANALADATDLAGYLQQQLGVKRGDRVILICQNSPQYLIAYYAILRADAVVVPLNPMLRDAELDYVATNCEADVAIVAADLLERFATTPLKSIVIANYPDYAWGGEFDRVPNGAINPVGDFLPPLLTEKTAPANLASGVRRVKWRDAIDAKCQPAPPLAQNDDLALLPYSSGTTGQPKGCCHPHSTLLATAHMYPRWNDFGEQAVMLGSLPMFHVTGMQASMNVPIMIGATIVMMLRWDKIAAADWLERYKVTSWSSITTMVSDFLDQDGLEQRDFSAIRRVGGGGASVPAALAKRVEELFGLALIEGYGLTETAAPTHINPIHRPKQQCGGIALFDTDARIIDPDTLTELGVDQAGEIIVNGPQIFDGYWRNEKATKDAFITVDGKRFLRTGDIAHYDSDGYFFITDRIKRMINASGFKIWPAEIEAMLFEHPGVKQACIISAKDAHRGETVKAVVVRRTEQTDALSEASLIEWARSRMAAYKVPRIVEFAESLPTSGSGKVLWRILQDKENKRQVKPQ